jgi:hypothetical protein
MKQAPPDARKVRRAGIFFVLGILLSGCLGADRTFPDESVSTTGLRVNAYTDVHSDAPHSALVELSGTGEDGEPRAFHGDVVLKLELQEGGQSGPATYRTVQEWKLSLGPQDFASGTIPYYKHVIPASDFPEEGTYRASAAGQVGGHSLSASALFAYVRQGLPSAP